jgi:hypothetical protein
MAAAFFPAAHRAAHPYNPRRPSRLTEVVIARNSRQEQAGFRSTAAQSKFAVEPQDGGAFLIRTADELMLTV